MAATRVNITGIHELRFNLTGSTSTSMPAPGTVQINNVSQSTHAEPLTDGNGNLIFAATLTMGGDIIVVTGLPN